MRPMNSIKKCSEIMNNSKNKLNKQIKKKKKLFSSMDLSILKS